jgi:hypothetical protein
MWRNTIVIYNVFFLNYKARFSTTSILKLTSSILKKYNRQRQFCAKKTKNERKKLGEKNKIDK